MEKDRKICTDEEPLYTVSMKKGYRILHVAACVFFLPCVLYFGFVSIIAGFYTLAGMLCFLGITALFAGFLFRALYELTKKCERYKGKVVYSFFLKKREYKLSEITSSIEKVEEMSATDCDGLTVESWDKVTTFYGRNGEKLFHFGLAYDNVQLLAKEVRNTQKSISNQKKRIR